MCVAPKKKDTGRASGKNACASRFGRAGVGLVSVALAGAILAPSAMADPIQNPLPPGVGSNPVPTTPNPVAPAVPNAVAPSNQGAGVIPDPPSTQWRPNPNTNNDPVNWGTEGGGYQAPTILDTVFVKPAPPMILPEPGILRVGQYQTEKPAWITMAELNSINRWSAYIESRVAQYWLSQGFSQKEADRRAASMMVGGLVGGAAGAGAGFALGVVPGALIGAPIGALAGAGIGAGVVAVGLAPINAFLPVAGTGIWINAIGAGALAGAVIGVPVGAAIGGAIGGLVVGVPGAALGVGLGSVFGGGDPNANINQPWLYRNGQGEITPKDNVLEFDWEGDKAVPALAGIGDAHVNLQVKDDDTWVVKFGDERWIGATQAERDKYFYGEMDKSIPGAGQAVRNLLEDKNGVFQNTIRDFLGNTAKSDPKNTQYNPDGDIADTSRREERVHYGYTSTPDRWDTPRYKDGENPVGGSENESATGELPPTDDQGRAAQGAPVQAASAPAPVPTPAVAPVPAPQASAPVVQTGIVEIDKPAADAQNALRQFIPGIPAA